MLRTQSLSWAESVRIALEAEGIAARVLDQNSFGVHGMFIQVRVAVLNDDQLPRARAILAALRPPAGPTPPSWRWQKRGLQVVGLGFVLMVIAAGMFDREEPVPVIYVYGAAGASALAFVVGFLLIALGPRADKERRL